ncbi:MULTISPECIES: hypothetical protein [Vibrio harveyi group]|uniref:hypothetical protein n=1 Tax=Vibrio harveyi group TaxID=717610 RepID=UPI001110CF4D|nr:hypothetical protein [Vibrio parahaemolyticus]MDG2761630.1 hypothetical protein [Vibrio parahaemolyticus]TMX40879.1 hypothetical protein DA098_03345 [Vibrio parahaemolyticus]TMX79816.1 hypothetical protein DA094_04855 [Vibrio parahaemolyticus]
MERAGLNMYQTNSIQSADNTTEKLRVKYNGKYDDTMAALSRQQWEDYINRFQPVEDKLIELATSNELIDNQIERNQEIAAKNLTQANQQASSSMAKFGLSDRRTAQQKSNLEMNNALSLASMNNNSREAVADLQRGIMTGAASGSKSMINQVRG